MQFETGQSTCDIAAGIHPLVLELQKEKNIKGNYSMFVFLSSGAGDGKSKGAEGEGEGEAEGEA